MLAEECKRCGECCKAMPCGISIALFDKDSCKALEKNGNGTYSCGLVLHASQYIDLGEHADWKDQFLDEMLTKMLGIGYGCDSSPQVLWTHRKMNEEGKRRFKTHSTATIKKETL